MVDEFWLLQECRVDIAVFNGSSHAFELKSDFDSFVRLPKQIDSYSRVFDYCTLVVTSRHLEKAREIIPRGWGLRAIFVDSQGQVVTKQLRKAKLNVKIEALPLVELLWRDEALAALASLGQDRGMRTRPRSEIHERLSVSAELHTLRQIVRDTIKSRQGWRVADPSEQCDERPQPARPLPDFLAARLRQPHRSRSDRRH